MCPRKPSLPQIPQIHTCSRELGCGAVSGLSDDENVHASSRPKQHDAEDTEWSGMKKRMKPRLGHKISLLVCGAVHAAQTRIEKGDPLKRATSSLLPNSTGVSECATALISCSCSLPWVTVSSLSSFQRVTVCSLQNTLSSRLPALEPSHAPHAPHAAHAAHTSHRVGIARVLGGIGDHGLSRHHEGRHRVRVHQGGPHHLPHTKSIASRSTDGGERGMDRGCNTWTCRF